MSAKEFDIEKYRKYPVIIPRLRVEARLKDYSPLFKAVYIIGIILIFISSIWLSIFTPDREIGIYLFTISILSTLPLTIYHMTKIVYGFDWIRMRVECELPYFTASLRYLLKTGKGLLESVKKIVESNVFPYISQTLYGVQDATSNLELESIADRSRSPILRRLIRELIVKKERVDILIDEVYRRYADYGLEYLNILNGTYRMLFLVIALSSLIPIYTILYHSFVYTELPDEYIRSWVMASSAYLSILLAGLFLILTSTVLLHRPSLYPRIRFRLDELLNWSVSRRNILVLTAIFIILALPATIYPIFIFIPISAVIYLLYTLYSTERHLKNIHDVLNDFSYLSREGELEYALLGMIGKKYNRYIDGELRYIYKRYEADGVLDSRDPNLKPYFNAISIAGKEHVDGLDEYTADVVSMLNIGRYVEGRFEAMNPKPYNLYIILFLLFIPVIYASGYILSLISLPILALLKMLGNMGSLFPYQNFNMTDSFSWENFWSNFNIDVESMIPYPKLSLYVYSLFGMLSTSIIFVFGILELLSVNDSRKILLYSIASIIFYSLIMLIGGFFGTLIGF